MCIEALGLRITYYVLRITYYVLRKSPNAYRGIWITYYVLRITKIPKRVSRYLDYVIRITYYANPKMRITRHLDYVLRITYYANPKMCIEALGLRIAYYVLRIHEWSFQPGPFAGVPALRGRGNHLRPLCGRPINVYTHIYNIYIYVNITCIYTRCIHMISTLC